MSLRGVPAPSEYRPAAYWEDRARRFAAEGDGLAAVCSYGMPEFYNRAIDVTQRRALGRWLAVDPGTRVLDVGCGVGRWSRRLAARGALVTGIDLSATMIEQARSRTARVGLAERCRYLVQDVVELEVGQSFDLILAVTVLQHLPDAQSIVSALRGMQAHLAPHGRLVLLEAAPMMRVRRCDSSVFQAHERGAYLRLFEQCGLSLQALDGVDPAPFRQWLLPLLPRLPRPLSLPALALVSALALPIDLLCARRAVRRSWHALFVLQRADAACLPPPLSTERVACA
ncbi:MAG TPA: class I SAM-dependent methyltransferase [Steroidobacteraceae bacterium]|jgi:SAM-dependent methyltransferase